MNDKQESNDLDDRFNKLRSALYEVVEDNKYDFSSNIFHILGIEHREVPITSYLAYLLDPRASHRQGILFLEEFLKRDTDVQKIENVNLNDTAVYTEYVISNNRRIDILLVNPEFVRIIEVKIYAKDQDSQLYDYVKAFCKYKNPKAIYLTLDGKKPSEASIKKKKDKLKEDDYICMSFIYDVMRMLNHYTCNYDSKDLNQFDYNFLQFKEDIEYMIGTNLYEVNKEIANFIFENPDNYRMAQKIFNYFNNSNNCIGVGINDRIHKKLKDLIETSWGNTWEYVDVDDPNNAVFYDKNHKAYFCIGKSDEKNPFCVGFVNVVKEGDGSYRLKDTSEETYPSFLSSKNMYRNKDYFWYCWKFLPSGKLEDPIFKDNQLNSSAIKLLKLDDMNNYIQECLNTIKNYLEGALEDIEFSDIKCVDVSDWGVFPNSQK